MKTQAPGLLATTGSASQGSVPLLDALLVLTGIGALAFGYRETRRIGRR